MIRVYEMPGNEDATCHTPVALKWQYNYRGEGVQRIYCAKCAVGNGDFIPPPFIEGECKCKWGAVVFWHKQTPGYSPQRFMNTTYRWKEPRTHSIKDGTLVVIGPYQTFSEAALTYAMASQRAISKSTKMERDFLIARMLTVGHQVIVNRRQCNKCGAVKIDGKDYCSVCHMLKGKGEYIGFTDALKAVIKRRDGHMCLLCKEDASDLLCIHHIDYDKENADYDNLVTLCKSCHGSTNGNRTHWRDYLQKVLTKQPEGKPA